MKTIPFWKMHGAKNDFILVDDREVTFPAEDAAWLAAIMSRRTGIGSEGVLLIQPSTQADFRMRFFNPDGGEVDMCGNGARCIARLAHEIGAAPASMRMETPAGIVRAEARGDSVQLIMTEPHGWRMHQSLDLFGHAFTYHFVNTGVPHVVIEVSDLPGTDVQRLGAGIRYHEAFAPKGTNANFIQLDGKGRLHVRTYERGVEGETLACGTGMVACGLVAGKLGRVSTPVKVIPASGDLLEVGYRDTPDGATDVTLLGPAVHVFQGQLRYP
ncbi:MAG TPA: diaminopimelate epimerase [Kiritimatiellia bacterium]|nr:diaminopimelate epimerase [Kiritimatiellia bacterium]HMP00431.1 diaminopimelate epimerase [Kiritimatiellia bacterium]